MAFGTTGAGSQAGSQPEPRSIEQRQPEPADPPRELPPATASGATPPTTPPQPPTAPPAPEGGSTSARVARAVVAVLLSPYARRYEYILAGLVWSAIYEAIRAGTGHP